MGQCGHAGQSEYVPVLAKLRMTKTLLFSQQCQKIYCNIYIVRLCVVSAIIEQVLFLNS